jgi:hypothetical protein
MRLSLLLAPILAAQALAGAISVDKRQASVLISAFSTLNSQLVAFDKQISALTASSDTAKAQTDLTAASQAIIQSMKTGEVQIVKAKTLGLLEVTGLVTGEQTQC